MRSVAFSADGKRIVSGSWDQTAKVWDVDKGQEVRTLKGHTQEVSSVAFSVDGKRIVSGSGGIGWFEQPLPGEVIVWDAVKGQELLTVKGLTICVTSVDFSLDGKRVIARDGSGEMRAWDAASGQALVPCTDPAPIDARTPLRPNGSMRATTDGAFIRVVLTADKRP